MLRCIPFLAASLLYPLTALPSPVQPGDLSVQAAKVRVVDLDEALPFYRDVLGLAVVDRIGDRVRLDGITMPLILEEAERPSRGGHPQASQTILVFQTSDIHATLDDLRRHGVHILSGNKPKPYGLNQDTGKPLGLSAKFRDPSGIVHSLVEQQVRAETFEGIRIYNIGFYLPDMDAARTLYSDGLGFPALTESYLPEALPLATTDGQFAFMLHARPELTPAPLRYPEDAQSLIVYETDDLDATVRRLEALGIERLHDTAQTRPGERFVAFRDPFGNVSEIVERN